MFGRRPDGIRLKNQDPIVSITPYLMPMRCDAQVFLEHKTDFELLSRYIAAQGHIGQKTSFMQIIIAAYVRAIAANPEVNRFIFNRQVFVRNNCSVSFTLLKDPQDADSVENTVRIPFDLKDTLYDVRDRINDAISKGRKSTEDGFAVTLARVISSCMARIISMASVLP